MKVLPDEGLCFLCETRPATYAVAGTGRILKGNYEGRYLSPGQRVCTECVLSELAKDENGNYVEVSTFTYPTLAPEAVHRTPPLV